jgi:hypothetical protein
LRPPPATVVLLLWPVFTLHAEDAGVVLQDPPTDIRRQMASEYTYSPPGKKEEPPPTSLNSSVPGLPPVPGAPGKDVVAMAPFEVRESGSAAMPALMPEAKAPESGGNTVAKKLGIGTHFAKLGKVRLFVTTVFYVPILAGFDW